MYIKHVEAFSGDVCSSPRVEIAVPGRKSQTRLLRTSSWLTGVHFLRMTIKIQTGYLDNPDNSCQLYMYREQRKMFHDVSYLSSYKVHWGSKHGQDGQFLVQMKPARLSQTCEYKSAPWIWHASSNDPIVHFAAGYGSLSNSMATLQVGVSKLWIFANTIPKKNGIELFRYFFHLSNLTKGIFMYKSLCTQIWEWFVSWPLMSDDPDLIEICQAELRFEELLDIFLNSGWKPSSFRAGNSPNLFGETKRKPEAALGFCVHKSVQLASVPSATLTFTTSINFDHFCILGAL